MNKKFKKRIMIMVCILSILVTSTSLFLAFGEEKAKAESYPAVKRYQKYLNENYGANLKVDGIFGCKTASAAVKVIQKLYNQVYKTGLAEDGKWGPKTEAAVNRHPIRKGARNKVVKFWQFTYNYVYHPSNKISVDGIFGSETVNALKDMTDTPEQFRDYNPRPTHIYATTWTYMLEFCSCGQFYICPISGI